MRITIDVSQMAYRGTGVGRYTFELCRSLLLSNTSHKFIFWTGSLRQQAYFKNLSKQAPWSSAKWLIHPLPPKIAGPLFNFLPITFDAIFDQPDLLHTSDWGEPNSVCPRVTTVHDLVFAKYPETLDSLILKTQKQRIKKLQNNNTFIITDSMSTKNDLVEMYHFDKGRIKVVYPGINTLYKPQGMQEIERVKTKYKLPDQFVLTLGTQEPRKNLKRLIQATQRANIPLVIAGKFGWGETVNPPANVQVLGFVDEADLSGLYSSAYVFALVSLYEGFGFPALEAMACGTAVVASNTSSIPELVGEAGILVDPINPESIANGIKLALSKKSELRDKGISQAAKFSWENTAKEVISIYEQIAQNRD